MVPVLEHSFLKFKKSLFSAKYSEIGWSTDTAKKEKPNRVSGLVVKHLIFLTGRFPSTLKSTSHPKDFPIQFFCITFTLLGQFSSLSKSLKRSSENFEILKNH